MSDALSDPTTVQYGKQAVEEAEAQGTSFQGNGSLGVIHSVSLEKLEPATTYKYRVGGPGDWSDTYEFTTAPTDPCAPFRFAAFGDNRPDTDWTPQYHWNPILAETADTSPAFILHTGDIVKDGGETGQWNTFFETSEPYLAYLPVPACIGNHDDGPGDGDSANYNQIFAFPHNEVTQTEDYYYFIYGNALFASLSSQTFEGGDAPMQTQADWLDQILTENPDVRWRFVFLHHPPYTSHLKFDLLFTEVEFNHPPNEKGQNPALTPVFDKHHVDIVFAGHNHYYERFGPMTTGSTPQEGTPVNAFAQGTVFVITGGAGAFVYDEFDILGLKLDLIDWVCGEAARSEVCSGRHHYTTLDIEDFHLHFEAWSTAEQTFGNDPANKKLIDSFDIYKEPTLECVTVEPADPAPSPEPGPEPEPAAEPDLEIVSPPESAEEIRSAAEPAEVLVSHDTAVAPAPDAVFPSPDIAGDAGKRPAGDDLCADGPCSDAELHPISSAPDSGCGCRTAPADRIPPSIFLMLAAAALVLALCRRRKTV